MYEMETLLVASNPVEKLSSYWMQSKSINETWHHSKKFTAELRADAISTQTTGFIVFCEIRACALYPTSISAILNRVFCLFHRRQTFELQCDGEIFATLIVVLMGNKTSVFVLFAGWKWFPNN